jgi:ribonuclease Z
VTLADGRTVVPADVLGPARAGRRIVLSGDTAPCRGVLEAAQGADVLVHEATFCEDERERARETSHSTAKEAAGVAKAAGVSLLALTHLSSRYAGPHVAAEAREVFAETVVPKDLDVIEVPFAERGPPRLEKRGAAFGGEAPVVQEAIPIGEERA